MCLLFWCTPCGKQPHFPTVLETLQTRWVKCYCLSNCLKFTYFTHISLFGFIFFFMVLYLISCSHEYVLNTAVTNSKAGNGLLGSTFKPIILRLQIQKGREKSSDITLTLTTEVLEDLRQNKTRRQCRMSPDPLPDKMVHRAVSYQITSALGWKGGLVPGEHSELVFQKVSLPTTAQEKASALWTLNEGIFWQEIQVALY